MKNRIQIFSSKRLRQIFNDLKRTSDVAKNELKISTKQLKSYLRKDKSLDIKLVEKICSKWPIHPQELISSKILFNKPYRFFSNSKSRKSSRTIKRGKINYYEYRDTVITNNAPFKPEWIRQLCLVKNNKPNNKNLKWNKGHLLHQLTYFVGKVNYYYIDKKGNKKVAIMNTGDAMYISPYTPHTFASRDKNLNAHIIAVTFTGKITNEVQNHLFSFNKKNFKNFVSFKSLKDLVNMKLKDNCITYSEFEKTINENNLRKKLNSKKIALNLRKKLREHLDINFNYFFPKVLLGNTIIKKDNSCLKYFFPQKNKDYSIKNIFTFNYLSGLSMFELKALKTKSKSYLDSSKHQYIYVLNNNLIFKYNNRVLALKEGDSLYIKPFEKFKVCGKNGKALCIRLEGNLSDQIMFELSRINTKDLERVINEKEKWF